MAEEYVVLVDENDNKIGLMPKMLAHEKALLHQDYTAWFKIIFEKFYEHINVNDEGNC